MNTYEIFELGVSIGNVSSTSNDCAKAHYHIATASGGERFVFKYDSTKHTLILQESCASYTNISDETSLFKFLYTLPDCSHGKLSTDISLGSKFYKSYQTNNYPTISSEKTLDGNNNKIYPYPSTPAGTSFGASHEIYIFKTDASLTLQNLTISGFMDHSLNIVDVNGPHLEISGCAFINNNVGVNINVETSNISTRVNNSVFKSLKANQFNFPHWTQNGGSAIRHVGNKLYITDCSFVDNSHYYNAGAILFSNILTLSGNNHFINNTTGAMQFGGAIQAGPNTKDGDAASLYIYGTAEFSKNKAALGGAIYVDTIYINDASLTFSENKASSFGGAILFAKICNIIDSSVSFRDNDASFGGAIWGMSYGDPKNLTITRGNIEFSGNTADNSGGAIYLSIMDLQGSLIIDSSVTFRNNSAADGSNIWAPPDIDPQTNFLTNEVTFNPPHVGVHPTFLDTSRAMEINHWPDLSNFMGSNTSYVGIIRQDISNISPISNISFNTSKTFYGSKKDGTYPVLSPSGTMNGPLIHSNSGDVYLYNLDISGFHNTHHGAQGTTVANISENIYINNCNIHDNSGFSTIYSANNVNITGNSIFSANHATYGGAIYSEIDITITNGNIEFSYNKSNGEEGGAIAAPGGTVIINKANVNFSYNTITGQNSNGGAIWAEKVNLSADASHKITFINNKSTNAQGHHIFAGRHITYNGSASDFTFYLPICSRGLNAWGTWVRVLTGPCCPK